MRGGLSLGECGESELDGRVGYATTMRWRPRPWCVRGGDNKQQQQEIAKLLKLLHSLGKVEKGTLHPLASRI